MSKAIANLDDLRRVQRAVRTSEENVKDALDQLKRELGRADWKDDRRRDFEAKLNEATSSVNRAAQQLSHLTPIIDRAIKDLSAYLQRR